MASAPAEAEALLAAIPQANRRVSIARFCGTCLGMGTPGNAEF
jgi:hypothetical protein